ncbi:unnamed protein product [Brachionus calyciflorus]|uniref:Apple domain-containing protein n=1 Tax=Brachionus calyciflorus TaxID=104777 RepID=A0A814S603_9BILA|nr:unnamed protein product [Brachionus calyciflorus]
MFIFKILVREECSGRCKSTPGCTHYAWSDYEDGICWMKTNGASKSQAIQTDNQNIVCGILTIPNSNQVEFITINNCPYTVWVGMQGRVYSNANWMLPNNGGWELKSGQTKSVSVPKDFYAGRLWGRTNCYYNNGQFRCETGDCGPWVECANGSIQRGGQTPATLAIMMTIMMLV